MEKLKELLKTDGANAQEYLIYCLAKAFVDISDGAVEAEFQREFEKIEIFMIVKRRGKNEK